MDSRDEVLFGQIMEAAIERFALSTQFSIEQIEGRRGLQIVLRDIVSKEIIKRSSLAKYLVPTGYRLMATEQEK